MDSNTPGAALPHVPCSGSGQTAADAPGSYTPSLAAHFNDNLIRHIQGWPSENIEKQVRKKKRKEKGVNQTESYTAVITEGNGLLVCSLQGLN